MIALIWLWVLFIALMIGLTALSVSMIKGVEETRKARFTPKPLTFDGPSRFEMMIMVWRMERRNRRKR